MRDRHLDRLVGRDQGGARRGQDPDLAVRLQAQRAPGGAQQVVPVDPQLRGRGRREVPREGVRLAPHGPVGIRQPRCRGSDRLEQGGPEPPAERGR